MSWDNSKIFKLLPLVVLLSGPIWFPWTVDFLKPRGEFDTFGAEAREKVKPFAMEDVFFIQSRGGTEETRLKARRVSSYDSNESLELEEVEAIVFDKDKRPIHIFGGQGVYDVQNQVLTLEKDVLVTTRDGYELRSPELRFQTKDKKVKTSEQVRMTGKNMKINGKGLSYDIASGAFRIGGRLVCNIW